MDISSLKEQARELERRGKTREALAMYRHALTSLEGTPALLGELPLYVKAGDLYLKLDNPRAAVSLYETAGKIYAAHGSAKSVSAVCAKVVRVMPERSHVYTRLVRIMLEHGHVAAARDVLLKYAEHADLHDTRARLEQLADRTDAHLHPVLEMLVEMAERLEHAGAPPEATRLSVPVEIPEAEHDERAAEAERPDGALQEPPGDGEDVVADEIPPEEEPPHEEDEPTSPERETGEPVPVVPRDGEPFGFGGVTAGVDTRPGDPVGLELVTSDLASEMVPPPPVEPPPTEERQDGRERDVPEAVVPEVVVERGAPWSDLPATPPVVPLTVPPEPSPPVAEAAPRERVRGNGTDWHSDPGLPGRVARRRSPVGSVLLAAAEREKSRTPWFVGGIVVVVLAIIAIVWLIIRSGGGENGGATGVVVDSESIAPAQAARTAAAPSDPATGDELLTLRPDPALSVESLAIPPLDTSLVTGAPPSVAGVTVVAIAGLPIDAVREIIVEGRTAYEVLQVLETGGLVSVLSLATSEPASAGAQAEVRIDAAPDGTRMARLRVGNHEVEVRGSVSDSTMRALVIRLAETSTSPG